MKNLRKRVGRFLLMFAMLFAGILLPQNTKAVWAADGSMTVHFLDVGQGLSVLVESEGQTLLYDGGPEAHPALWYPICRNGRFRRLII